MLEIKAEAQRIPARPYTAVLQMLMAEASLLHLSVFFILFLAHQLPLPSAFLPQGLCPC